MDAREALVCARLNLRGAKLLLQKGSLRRGVSTLYDSVLFGMYYYVARHEACADVDMGDATGLFHWLTRLGVFEDQHAFNRLSLTIERALWQGVDSFDANAILVEVEAMLTKLGVMTFQKSTFVKKL
jgi:hypothetical protein